MIDTQNESEGSEASIDQRLDSSGLAKLCLDFSLITSDYKFWRQGGTIRYVLDPNFIDFCVWPGRNEQLVRFPENEDPSFLKSYALAVAQLLIDYLEHGDLPDKVEPKLSIFEPHYDEFLNISDRSAADIAKVSERAYDEAQKLNEIIELLLAKETDADKIVEELKKFAPSVIDLLSRKHDRAINLHSRFSDSLVQERKRSTRGEKPYASRWEFFVNALLSMEYERSGRIDPKSGEPQQRSGRKFRNARVDSRALIQLELANEEGAAQSTGRRATRYILLTTDQRICAIVNMLRSIDPAGAFQNYHVRNSRLLPFMVGFSGTGDRLKQASRQASNVTVALQDLFSVDDHNLSAIVTTAYPQFFKSSKRTAIGEHLDKLLALHLPDVETIDLDLQEGTRDTVMAALTKAKQELKEALNLVVAENVTDSYFTEPIDQTAERVFKALNARAVKDAVSREIEKTLDRAVNFVGFAQMLGVRDLLDSVGELLKAYRKNRINIGLMPFALRDGEDGDRYLETLATALQSMNVGKLIDVAPLSPYKVRLATAFILGRNGRWHKAEEYCLQAIGMVAQDETMALEEAYLLLAATKRFWNVIPRRLEEASELLDRGERRAIERPYNQNNRDLRFASERVSLSIVFFNHIFFVGEREAWRDADNSKFLTVNGMWDQLTALKHAVEAPGWMDPSKAVADRLRIQVYGNICVYCLTRWVWLSDLEFDDAGAYEDALRFLENLLTFQNDDRVHLARYVYLMSIWYLEADEDLAAQAGKEMLREMSNIDYQSFALEYESVENQRLRELLEAARRPPRRASRHFGSEALTLVRSARQPKE